MFAKIIGIYAAGGLDILLGLIVCLRNRHEHKNFAFLLMTLAIGSWSFAVGIFLQVKSSAVSMFWINVVSQCMILIPTTLYHFSIAVAYKDFKTKIKTVILVYLINIPVLIFVLLPGFCIKEVIVHPWGKESVLLWGYYFISIIYIIIVGLA